MINWVPFKELETERLVLRKLRIEDAEVYHEEISSRSEVAKYMLWTPNDSINQTIEFLKKAIIKYNEKDFYRWAIVRKDGNQLIGVIQLLNFNDENNSCGFAYMLGSNYWNRGYMTECLKIVLSFAFTDLKLDAVGADHFIENPASGKVMIKAGMSFTGFETDKYANSKGLKELACYKITREEFLKSDLIR